MIVSGTVPAGGSIKVLTGSGFSLKNTGGTVSLLNPSGVVADSFTYTTAADGMALQPAAFLTPAMKAELFDELATTSPVVGPLSAGQSGIAGLPAVAGGTIGTAIAIAVVLALGAVYVLKSVRYDEVIRNPFLKDKKETKDLELRTDD